MTDYVLPWDQPSGEQAREGAARRRHAPGLWAQRLVPGEPPAMPPDFAGVYSCCTDCPRACCTDCPPNREWTRFHEKHEDTNTTPRLTWWERLTGRTPQENHA